MEQNQMTLAKVPPVILIGLTPQGLFLLRELSRAGFEVHAITDRRTPGYYSRYGQKYLISNEDDLRSILQKLREQFGKTRCYIASGAFLDAILKDLPELFGMFEVYPRPIEAVAVLNNKLETYRLAEALGVRTLPTYRVTQSEDIEAAISSGEKLIAKWNRNISFDGQQRFKTTEVSTLKDFRSLVGGLTASEEEHLILQQYVHPQEGPTAYLGGYFAGGACIAAIVAEEVRYHKLGIASYVREMKTERLKAELDGCLRLLEHVRYTGFADIEFKYIPNRGELYLLEVNARPWGSMSILKAKFGNLCSIWENPGTPAIMQAKRNNSRWCSLFRDMAAIAKLARYQRSLRPFATGVLSMAAAHDYDIVDLRDIMPIWRQVFRGSSANA